MKKENLEKSMKRILKILEKEDGPISTTELSILSKINYYRIQPILAKMEKDKKIKSEKGSDKRGSVYWSLV